MRHLHEFETAELEQTFADSYSELDDPSVIVDKLNGNGFATFEGVTSPEQFLTFAATFGAPRVHAQTDGRGITTLTAGDHTSPITDGFAVTPYDQEQLFHTDGSIVAGAPGAVAIYCATQDPIRKRVNVFAGGRSLQEALQTENPDLLSKLRQPISFGSFEAPVFEQRHAGLTRVRFRQAPQPPRMSLSADDIRLLDNRLRQPDQMRGVALEAGQGVIFNNFSVFHALSCSWGVGRTARRIQLTLHHDSGILAGFKNHG